MTSFYRRATGAIDPMPLSVKGAQITPENGWSKYFGPPKTGFEAPPYDENDRTTWSLPEGYLGDRKVLAETFEVLAFLADSFYTAVLMPMKKHTGALRIDWTHWEFEPKLANIVSELAPYRLLTSKRISGTSSFVRKSIGFMLEWGFMHTPRGGQHYMRQFAQINNSITDSNNFGVLYALLTAHDSNQTYLKDRQVTQARSVAEVLKRETMMWDIVRKHSFNGLEVLDTHIKVEIKKFQGKATTYVWPEKIAQWLSQVPRDRLDYSIRGASGPATLQNGINSYDMIRNQRAYTVRTFAVDPKREIDIMRFHTQIGGYHTMYDFAQGNDESSYEKYSSRARSIQIYSVRHNKFVELSQKWAIEHQLTHHAVTGEVLNTAQSGSDYDTKLAYTQNERAGYQLAYVSEENGGELRACKYWGQMGGLELDGGLTLADAHAVAVTAHRTVTRTLGGSCDDVRSIWNNGMLALDMIDSYSYDEAADAYAMALAIENGPSTRAGNEHLQVKPVGANGCPSRVELLEWKPTSLGTLRLPVNRNIDESIKDRYQEKFLLPPFMGTYAGFATIRDAYRRNVYVGTADGELGFSDASREWFGHVAKFTDLFDAIVLRLGPIFPGSVSLDATYAGSQWHRASAATVLFESEINNGGTPMWLRVPGGEHNQLGQLDRQRVLDADMEDSFRGAYDSSATLVESLKRRLIGPVGTNADKSMVRERPAFVETALGADPDSYSWTANLLTSDTSALGHARWGDSAEGKVLPAYQDAPAARASGTPDEQRLIKTAWDFVAAAAFNYRPDVRPLQRFSPADEEAIVNGGGLPFVARVRAFHAALATRALVLAALQMISTSVPAPAGDAVLAKALIVATRVAAVRQQISVPVTNLAGLDANTVEPMQLSEQQTTELINNVAKLAKRGKTRSILTPQDEQGVRDRLNLVRDRSANQLRDAVEAAGLPYSGVGIQSLVNAGELVHPAAYNRAPLRMSPRQYTTLLTYVTAVHAHDRGAQSDHQHQPAAMPSALDDGDSIATLDELEHHTEALERGSVHPQLVETRPARNVAHISQVMHMQTSLQNAALDMDMRTQALGRMNGRQRAHARLAEATRGASSPAEVPAPMEVDIGGRIDDLHDAKASAELAFRRPPQAGLRSRKRSRNVRGDVLADGSRASVMRQRRQRPRDPRRVERSLGRMGGIGCFGERADLMLAKHVSLPRFVRLYEEAQAEELDDFYRMLIGVFMLTPLNIRSWKAMDAYNVLLPVEWKVFRPHQRFETLAIMKLLPGAETGITYVGNSAFTTADDSSIGLHTGWYKWYVNHTVMVPKNIWTERYAYIDGYNGGMDKQPFEHSPERYNPADGVYGNGSTFVCLTKRGEHDGIDGRGEPNPISLTGKYHYLNLSAVNIYDEEDEQLHYSSAPHYNGLWGWHYNGVGVRQDSTTADFWMEVEAANSICFSSHQFGYCPRTESFDYYRPQTGHFLPEHIGPGFDKVVAGLPVPYKVYDYTSLSRAGGG